MHTDHLGSTSTLSYLNPNDGTAGRVYDSRAFYTPFGDYRLEPTGDYTDQGYTGHLGNNSGSNDIGLIYMNARFYVPSIARFASADTIVPSPANPQSFNRYSYGYNNPVKYFDPTGHRPCETYCRTDELDWKGQTFADGWGDAEFEMDRHPETLLTTVPMFIGAMAAPTVIGYAATELALPSLAKIGTKIAQGLCLDGDCLNEVDVVYDYSLNAGEGLTNNLGTRITISPLGTSIQRLQALYHEQVHVILSPRGPLQEVRANVSMWAYQNSHLLRYAEEAIAESSAQIRTGGSLWTGLSFPITHNYVDPARATLEGIFVTAGSIWGGTQLGNTIANWLDN